MKIFDPQKESNLYSEHRGHPLMEVTLEAGEGIVIFGPVNKKYRMFIRVRDDGKLHIEVNPEMIENVVGYGLKGKIFDAEVTLDRPVY